MSAVIALKIIRSVPRFLGFAFLPLLASCSGGSGSNTDDSSPSDEYTRYMSSIGINEPIQVELTDDNDASRIPSPTGAGFIVDDRLIVDFSNTISLDEIDSTLASYNLSRLGYISGFNIVTVGLPPGANEQEYRSVLDALSAVNAVSYDYELQDRTASGSNTGVDVSDVAYPNGAAELDALLRVNWPHYIMDTFPAHALIELLQRSGSLDDSTVAVMEKTSFHSQSADRGTQASIGSILALESGDADIARKVVNPTGILTDAAGRRNYIDTFSVSSNNNSKLFINDDDFHALYVSSAAVGAGEHVLGTGKHVNLMPVLLTRARTKGVCRLDRNQKCTQHSECFDRNVGSCDKGWSTTESLAGILSDLGQRLNSLPDGDAVRVINMSIGFRLEDQQEADSLLSLFQEPVQALLTNQRVLVIAAGNDRMDADLSFPANLAPPRGEEQADSTGSQIVVVSGSAQPRLENGVLDFTGSETYYVNSNVGKRVHVSAPSDIVPLLIEDLQSTILGGGTSFGSPYVAGAIAELFLIDPEMSASEAVEILKATADDLGDIGPDDTYGYGRINLWKAVLTVLNRRSNATDPEWIGLRFRVNAPIERSAPIDPSLIVFVNKEPVEGSHARETLYFPDSTDNSTLLVSQGYSPSASTIEISVNRDEFTDLGQFSTVSLDAFEESPSGISLTTQLEIPIRMKELRQASIFTSSFDDYVATIDIGADLAEQRGFVFGRVLNEEGAPVEGANIRYNAFDDTLANTFTDADGLFVAYDVFADPDYINTLQIVAEGYQSYETNLDIAPLRTARIDAKLVSLPDTDDNGQQAPTENPDTSTTIAINVNEGRCGRNVWSGGAADFSNPDNYEFKTFNDYSELVAYLCEFSPGTTVCGYTKQEDDVQLSIASGYLSDVATRECSL